MVGSLSASLVDEGKQHRSFKNPNEIQQQKTELA